MKKRAVIALGGNALIKPGQTGTIYEQFANTRQSAQTILKIIQDGWNIVLTHGNGPQVGTILLQNQAAKEHTPPMPLGICVAESEGLIGYMIQQCLGNALREAQIQKSVITLITQVVVDKTDPALTHPTKPIGPYYNEQDAKAMIDEGYQMIKQKQGWRMVVPSPDPKNIVEGDIIRQLLDAGIIVIAAGGGGMPVVEKEHWGYDGLEVVIDKDLAAERLAEAVQARLLVILTDVEYVYLFYGTSQQQALKSITLDDAKRYYAQGHFSEGSMGPKILAAIRFLEFGGEEVIISTIEKGWDALQGTTGTILHR